MSEKSDDMARFREAYPAMYAKFLEMNRALARLLRDARRHPDTGSKGFTAMDPDSDEPLTLEAE
jgi:hypothetical protein